MAKPLRLGVAYDFRNPPESGLTHQTLYAAIMDQVAWLDGLGLDLVWFTEHHFVDDGYLPSWIPVAAAMAARTKKVRFSCDVCLLPFNHPIRLAEDLAVLDNISGGRVEMGVGMGYAPHEFRGFGLPVSRPGAPPEEGRAPRSVGPPLRDHSVLSGQGRWLARLGRGARRREAANGDLQSLPGRGG